MGVGTRATWKYDAGELVETTAANAGLLDLRWSERGADASDPEISVDVVYGGFYIGELDDYLESGYPDDDLASFQAYLHANPALAAELNEFVHAASGHERIDAIDRLWAGPAPGLEIEYDFAMYVEKMTVLEPVMLDHVRAQGGKLRTVVVEVARHLNEQRIATSTYWFEDDAGHRLVQWGHDMGSEYHLEVLQPDD